MTTAVVSSFGSWSSKPFAAIVLVAFLACGMAAQSVTARTMYSVARDGARAGLALPAHGSTAARSRSARSSSTTVLACLGLLLGLDVERGRDPDRVRHRRDLRLVPADRAGGADRARARARGSPAGSCGSARAGLVINVAGGGLAGVRDGQHRLAARVARAARRALLPGVGGAAAAGADRHGRASPTC